MPSGPRPKSAAARARSNEPVHDWKNASSSGWQHGKTPAAPAGMKPASRSAWRTWFESWFAAFWMPEDVPGLRVVVLLYDQVERGEFQRVPELRLQMDTYGITPKGQQDRRWKPPVAAEADSKVAGNISRYDHLRAVQ